MKQTWPFWAFLGLLLVLVGAGNLALAHNGLGMAPLLVGLMLLVLTVALTCLRFHD